MEPQIPNSNKDNRQKIFHTLEDDLETIGKEASADDILQKKKRVDAASQFLDKSDAHVSHHSNEAVPSEISTAPRNSLGRLSPIRTYASDVGEAIHNKNTSLIDIALAENARKTDEKEYAEDTARKKINGRYFIATLSIILLAAGIIWTVIALIDVAPRPIIAVNSDGLITADDRIVIKASDLDRTKLRAALIAAEKSLPPAGLFELYLEKTPATKESASVPLATEELFLILETSLPPELLRAFQKKFFLGVEKNREAHFFIIIPLDSYENGFAGMLRIEENLHALFKDLLMLKPLYTILSTPVATSTASTTPDKKITAPRFGDVLIHNKDARILKTTSGESSLIYAFPDTGTLIITDTPETYLEISRKLDENSLVR
ncbi:MAG: hypothetical protein A2928_02945 [Candidatus Taylorbacteria bacterium RIFCSPLOWO2_01_FULL_45_15b]|uniref:Uncharacterized protein n=1 Tax=Candidatus Taylorbacteria bacterium RIFCSPLOWO2_01_FULL_45_15b TaxID=1802319 RepID=A0A1G2NC48_9BACT|nr:MAG: hypothetical protein A2928_02945 [Candidatus Taylorbacteria bacterium RIFCSPLOWO2_01_FULL_45_15b]